MTYQNGDDALREGVLTIRRQMITGGVGALFAAPPAE
jgi:hypothetical protein